MNRYNLMITLGKIMDENGHHQRALDTFTSILQESPRNIDALILAAAMQEKLNNFSAAAELVQRALPCATNAGKMLELNRKLGALYVAANMHFKAIRVYQAVDELSALVETQPDDVTTYLAKPEVPEANGEDNAHVWNELGLVLFKVGSYDDAVDAYQTAIRIDPMLPFVHSNLSQAYLTQGKLEEALLELEELIKLLEDGTEIAEAWTRIRSVYRLQGEMEMAGIVEKIIAELNSSAKKSEMRFATIQVSDLVAREVDDDMLDDLVRSIKLHGILQPLIVTPIRDSQLYSVVAGNRRFAAAKLAGQVSVPAIIRNLTDAESIEIRLHENMHNGIKDSGEIASDLQKLASEHDYSIDEIANRVGVSAYAVANSLKAPTANRIGTPAADLEKEMIRKMIGQLGVDLDSEEVDETNNIVSNTDFGAEVNTLWYMQPANVAPIAEPIEIENNSLFSRAANMLRQNPHPTRLWL